MRWVHAEQGGGGWAGNARGERQRPSHARSPAAGPGAATRRRPPRGRRTPAARRAASARYLQRPCAGLQSPGAFRRSVGHPAMRTQRARPRRAPRQGLWRTGYAEPVRVAVLRGGGLDTPPCRVPRGGRRESRAQSRARRRVREQTPRFRKRKRWKAITLLSVEDGAGARHPAEGGACEQPRPIASFLATPPLPETGFPVPGSPPMPRPGSHRAASVPLRARDRTRRIRRGTLANEPHVCGSDQMAYVVYKNRPNKFATVHRSTCNRPRQHGGVSRRHPPTGTYVDGLSTRGAAIQEARSTGWDVRLCRFCAP